MSQIIQVPTDKLIPYVNNSRTHSAKQVDQIAASIKEFGFTNPVLTDGENGIIAGHGRVMAAKKLGIEMVPCIELSHLTPTQRKAYIIADNKMALNADWDNELLALELSELKDAGYDMDLTGFSPDEFEALIPEQIADGLTDEDEVPEVPADPITKLGDVWVLGNHRLMCGDSTNIQSIDILTKKQTIAAVITDPPYGIGIDGQKESISQNPKHNRKAHEFRGWDNKRPDAGIFNFIVALNCPAVIWGGNYFADLLPATRGWIYWNKGQDGLTMSDGELAWSTEDKPLRAVTVNRGALKGSVHPTQKPLEVIEFSLKHINAASPVLDLFGGSGSTLIACEKTGIESFLMELDPKYCDVIVKRWQEYTGKEAVHEETGKTFAELAAV